MSGENAAQSIEFAFVALAVKAFAQFGLNKTEKIVTAEKNGRPT